MTAYNVAVIGAGQIGVRHVESMINFNFPLNIYVVDPNNMALQKLNNFYDTVNSSSNLFTMTTIDSLPNKVDLVIISTSADIRYSIIESVLDKKFVTYFLLEKILFQDLDEYEKVQSLLKKHQVESCWVNCPLRTFPFFKELKSKLSDSANFYYEAKGNQLGITCNSIHHIDLFLYLSNSYTISLNKSNLKDVVKSKRKGFYEILGTLEGRTENNSHIKITSEENDNLPYTILIQSDSFSCEIWPSLNKVILPSDNKITIETPFMNIPQSQLTGRIVKEILETGKFNLPHYEFSKIIHLALITTFNNHFSKEFGTDVRICPIT
ncbi:hypothetical protein CN354_14490 [Bacillus cereus]|nr:hypothetical protein CN354_14490 [Bacillus cereus]